MVRNMYNTYKTLDTVIVHDKKLWPVDDIPTVTAILVTGPKVHWSDGSVLFSVHNANPNTNPNPNHNPEP